jgi:uncharacterized membrane protein
MANHTTVKAKNKDTELTLSQHSSDSPILPIPQIERLQEILPERVSWVFDQTQAESEHRRSQQVKINNYVFIERMLGQIFGLVVALSGLSAAAYMATNGAQTAGGVIGGVTLVAMVAVFVKSRPDPRGNSSDDDDDDRPARSSKTRK